MAVSAREAAVTALGAYRRSGAWSDAYLNGVFKKENMDSRDKALATRLSNGVLQNMSLIDYRLGLYVKGGIGKLQPIVLDILRVSAYQIMFMDKIPHSAAVNEGVAIAKKLANKAAAGLVNAVLRRISENVGKYPEPKEPWTRYSHTEQWYKYFSALIGAENAEKLMAEDNAETDIALRANPLRCTPEELIASLEAEVVSARKHDWLDGCVVISGAGSPGELKAFKDGLAMVQDAAAAMAVLAAEPQKGEEVLDACSAPGGKSFLSAMLMGNEGSILSCDLHANKLKRIDEGAERLHIDIISTAPADGSKFNPALEERFDLVIADVPCSGMGVVRKKPEIRYKSFEDIAQLPEIQYNILMNLARYVKPDGRLVYSTCTLIREENEGVTEKFLSKNHGFTKESFTLPQPIGEVIEGEKTLWPFEYGTDGFYICRMRKKK
ncbi:MAG: 16S rRNA (cytosine(967)-C(5))-methyltransferase RsmB [Oscillospiraceae bacterium]|nr:16S rRNA (cytosine(967)-C(5))-methyltransferase RsmB [Oscillospiraceae bacterium]